MRLSPEQSELAVPVHDTYASACAARPLIQCYIIQARSHGTKEGQRTRRKFVQDIAKLGLCNACRLAASCCVLRRLLSKLRPRCRSRSMCEHSRRCTLSKTNASQGDSTNPTCYKELGNVLPSMPGAGHTLWPSTISDRSGQTQHAKVQ